MAGQTFCSDNVHWYMSELTSRVVADSGQPSDRHHLGKIILQGLKDDLDFVLQIDGGTGRSETSGSVLRRSIQCAIFLKTLGLQRGDLILLTAPTHLDLAIPFYAAMYLGITVVSLIPTLRVFELEQTFKTFRPRVVFSQCDSLQDIQEALGNLKMDAKLVTFDKGPEGLSLAELLEQYSGNEQKFKADDFDPADTTAVIVPTGGSTGKPKACEHTHKYLAVALPYKWISFTKFPTPVQSMFVGRLQHMTSISWFLTSPFLRFTRIQSSHPFTNEHICEIFKKYKPSYIGMSSTYLGRLLQPGQSVTCDITCFDTISFVGRPVHDKLIAQIKALSPKTRLILAYGSTETVGWSFHMVGGGPKPGRLGYRHAGIQYKLVSTTTQEEILEPNVPGELWLKGPVDFKGYYDNPETTAESKSVDGWFKTGDMVYRDEGWCYYFYDRINMRIVHRGLLVSAVEIEGVIQHHPDVLDAVVTSVPHAEFTDLPVACVVRRPGSTLSGAEVKELVKRTLSDHKHLRGGVVFLEEIPHTPMGKVDRLKLKNLVLTLDRV